MLVAKELYQNFLLNIFSIFNNSYLTTSLVRALSFANFFGLKP